MHCIMGNCRNCNKNLSKSTKGTLCRNCYRERNTVNKKMINKNDNLGDLNSSKVVINNEKSNDDPILNDDITNDKNIIEFIKDNMMKEKLWNVEMRDLLESQINYLKTEIIAKNNIIEQLTCELSYRNRIGNKSENSVINTTLNNTNSVDVTSQIVKRHIGTASRKRPKPDAMATSR